ncbi:MAG: NAD-binding protein [Candidatus Methanospirare jalkutatii]|nr:NAD-binding protein [Methanophagales archaeon]MCW3131696.1 NAD-binding protein [Candidatus Methanospirare jalkutatii]MCW7079659.1 NAD-binding protein [Candidatus Methanospirare jalkutatii]
MYLIIVGLGGIGRNLVEIATKDKNDVVVIDKDEKKCMEIASKYDVLTIAGDASQRETLEDAGADQADALIATTSDDSVNLMVALTAKELGTKRVASVVNQEEHVEMFEKEGVFLLQNPDKLIATHLYYSLKRPRIKCFLSIGAGKAEVFEVVVSEKSHAVGKKVSEIKLKDGVIVAIERNGNIILPKDDTIVKSGDTLTIFALSKAVEKISSFFSP